ncbi:MAG TPA: methylcobamide--CoM methyltransferase [Firmicutes bacterium]|jgi:MtaA/CmuA family methyltransferase|nr:methylcobamide--CoM methyltransferase [Bacillota bacterium]
MSQISAKKRFLAVMNNEKPDRPPVICPGGMMNAAIVEAIQNSGTSLPEAHRDPKLMAQLARAVQLGTGFENFGIPFCMTVEAEVLGSQIDFGSLTCEPKIAQEKYGSSAEIDPADIVTLLGKGRIGVVAEAARILAKEYPSIPILGSLTGPMSLAASIINPLIFLKDLRKNPALAHGVLDYVTKLLIGFSEILAESGVTAISIADPTATGEILGPAMFKEYEVPHLQKLIAEIHRLGLPVILHICGDLSAVKPLLGEIGADVISVDAVMSLKKLKEEFPILKTMGNLSTFLLDSGPAARIQQQTGRLMQEEVDIIAPACGLSTSTPLENIRAFTAVVTRTS